MYLQDITGIIHRMDMVLDTTITHRMAPTTITAKAGHPKIEQTKSENCNERRWKTIEII